MSVRSWSLSRKVGFSLLCLSGFSIIGAVLGVWYSLELSDAYESTIIEVELASSELAIIESSLHEVQALELATDGARLEQRLGVIENHFSKINHAIEILSEDRQNGINQVYIQSFAKASQAYREIISNQIQYKDLEGSLDEGLIGALTKSASSMARAIEKSQSWRKNQALVHLLRMREQEKNFQIFRDDKWFIQAESLGKRFQSFLSQDYTFSRGERRQLKRLSQGYLEQLNRLKKNHGDLRRAHEGLVEKRRQLINNLKQIRTDVHEFAENRIVQNQALKVQLEIFYVFIVVLILVISILSTIAVMRIVKDLGVTSRKLRKANRANRQSSSELGDASRVLSSAVVEQGSAIQETVATLNEITAMVRRSLDHAEKAAQNSKTSHDISHEGREVVAEMRQSMLEIKSSLEQLSEQSSKNNDRMSQTVKIIHEIRSKTGVINDIVFQTKLLSFNASVEAARAGKEGLGFAVVAQEIGNLATLSGKAAKDISSLLQQSQEDVDQIVQESRASLTKVMAETSAKVDAGAGISDRCESILAEVVDHATHVNRSMEEILEASREQAEGIQNISQAMDEIDSATMENSEIADRTASASLQLDRQAQYMSRELGKLECAVLGGKPQPGKQATKPPPKPPHHSKPKSKIREPRVGLENDFRQAS
ncbi:methyl-accepting chemotaxis protein [Pseudobacteriovorax antillogorgiicola]|uniref:Methyl-accepting chemotaxis protein n=1 Tax=Pseudobacteriovorax antillogorgiicola TaxID=1513793 RepID=A0A1Y6BEQ7_9BACT|nr:methyl-accepting chemotaxis protein [Pseudobacteriovorax antillogorgiicola]TCS57569.1 methyl-accepting chemotaxis protein [Pseudobacteriovorax antillogorgiicola]SME99712.1 Methyl-accepting chemotaxis protein [Pseudobacteriovorax antillogorgiicola]